MIFRMNNPDNIIMNDNADHFIQQCFKNWAAEQHPPAEVRTRLLHAASPFYLKIFNASPFQGDSSKPIATLTSYRSPINKRTDARGQTQLWAWHMTMTTLRFIA